MADARELAAAAREITAATDGRLTDHLATLLAVRYASALSGWNGEVTEAFRRKRRALRGLCQDIVELRRGDHSGARLQMEQTRLERKREKTQEEVVAHFQRWLKNPEVRDLVCQNYVSPEERERRMRAIFGRSPLETGSTAAESNPVKLDLAQTAPASQSKIRECQCRKPAPPPVESASIRAGRLYRPASQMPVRVTPHSAAFTHPLRFQG